MENDLLLVREETLANEAFAAVNSGDTATVVRRVERLRVMASRVRSLHRSVDEPCLAPACANADCDHEDECPPASHVAVCAYCFCQWDEFTGHDEMRTIPSEVMWPCGTIKELDRD